ncbi:hypothetical protein ACFQ14_12805 [Pseudahrensia aquimaris]|uniref:Uncharacterized protein n=1 Tax=Pseudahrensia aquimaris TaxID=744461 RepID=A0ABW3FFN0_9HYPH
MSVLLHKLARYVVQKATSDPEARDKVLKVALRGVDEAKQIAKENDRAYAVGRALRRALKGL